MIGVVDDEGIGMIGVERGGGVSVGCTVAGGEVDRGKDELGDKASG